jgi:hypothetical protein
MTAEVISYPGGGGDEIHAWLARPDGDGPTPGIVAVHHMPGWDEFYREFCERLARHGHIVICPDLYCRFGHGRPDDVTAMVRSWGGVHDGSMVADCAAALSWLKALPASNGRAGVIGTCSGGRPPGGPGRRSRGAPGRWQPRMPHRDARSTVVHRRVQAVACEQQRLSRRQPRFARRPRSAARQREPAPPGT